MKGKGLDTCLVHPSHPQGAEPTKYCFVSVCQDGMPHILKLFTFTPLNIKTLIHLIKAPINFRVHLLTKLLTGNNTNNKSSVLLSTCKTCQGLLFEMQSCERMLIRKTWARGGLTSVGVKGAYNQNNFLSADRWAYNWRCLQAAVNCISRLLSLLYMVADIPICRGLEEV